MSEHRSARFGIDPESVTASRAQLREIVRGTPIAEAAVEGFSDWQVIEMMERLWAVGTSESEPLKAAAESLSEAMGQMDCRQR